MAYYYLPIYFIIFAIGCVLPQRTHAGAVKAGWIMVIFGLLAGILLIGSSWGVHGAWVRASYPFYILVVPIFLIGLALLLGLKMRKGLREGNRGTGYGIGFLTLLIPCLGYLWIIVQVVPLRPTAQQIELKEAEARFITQTVSVNLGGHVVRFPISPQIETSHICGNRRVGRACLTAFSRNTRRFERDIKAADKKLSIQAFTLRPVLDTCESADRSDRQNKCLSSPALKKWCEAQTEYTDSIWCQKRPKHELRFQLLKDQLNQSRVNIEWGNVANSAVAFDSQRRSIMLQCNSNYKRRFKDDVNRNLCRIRYQIDTAIIAEINFEDFSLDNAKDEVKSMMQYADSMWLTMKLN